MRRLEMILISKFVKSAFIYFLKISSSKGVFWEIVVEISLTRSATKWKKFYLSSRPSPTFHFIIITSKTLTIAMMIIIMFCGHFLTIQGDFPFFQYCNSSPVRFKVRQTKDNTTMFTCSINQDSINGDSHSICMTPRFTWGVNQLLDYTGLGRQWHGKVANC